MSCTQLVALCFLVNFPREMFYQIDLGHKPLRTSAVSHEIPRVVLVFSSVTVSLSWDCCTNSISVQRACKTMSTSLQHAHVLHRSRHCRTMFSASRPRQNCCSAVVDLSIISRHRSKSDSVNRIVRGVKSP